MNNSSENQEIYTKTQPEIELALVEESIKYLILHGNIQKAVQNAINYFDVEVIEGSQFLEKDQNENAQDQDLKIRQ